jgi:hypothetical protein
VVVVVVVVVVVLIIIIIVLNECTGTRDKTNLSSVSQTMNGIQVGFNSSHNEN